MSGNELLREALELGWPEGSSLLQDKITTILAEPYNVPQQKYETYFKALGKAYVENEEDFAEGKESVLEDEAMNAIDDALYAEMCERLEVPDPPEDDLLEIISDAWDEAVEEIVLNVYLPED